MCDWVCYLIMSLDSNATYIGSSNNQPKRLANHNNCDPRIRRRGAKRTRGQTWITIIAIQGFPNKNACLSFESGWKRLAFSRSTRKLYFINIMSGLQLSYTGDTRWNRIMDLLYFTHNFTLYNDKFKINPTTKFPVCIPDQLTINIFMEEWIKDLPWPPFVSVCDVQI